MGYRVKYSEKALKNLLNIDKGQREFIISWVEKNLINTKDPRMKGKALKGSLKAYWRYRVGSYRLITEIKDSELIILIVMVGHRKNIY